MSATEMESGSNGSTQETNSSVETPNQVSTAPEVTKEVTAPESSGLDKLKELAKGEFNDDGTVKSTKTPAKKAVLPATDKTVIPAAAGEKTLETPAFTPNYKFKVMDKEHEIPEALRAVMKDPETEKLVRELHEKAYGLDIVKPKFVEERKLRQQAQQENAQLISGINDLRGMYAKNDFDSFFKRLAIPQEKVLQWVVDKLNYNELPPEQKQALDQRKSAEERAWQAEQQVSSLQQKYEQETLQAREFQLKSTLDRAEYKAAAEAFDTRPGGKPGDFWDAVCERGETTWIRTNGKVDLSPEQAVQEVIRLYGIQPKQVTPAATSAAVETPPAAVTPPVQVSKTPVIPNVAGGTTSPMKSKPRSIADLKKLAADMQ